MQGMNEILQYPIYSCEVLIAENCLQSMIIYRKIGGKNIRFHVEDSKNARMNANILKNSDEADVWDNMDNLQEAGLIDKNNMIRGGQTCNKCKGKGYINDHICYHCAGIGRNRRL